MDNLIKQIILEKLKELPVCIPNSDETEWTVRCPYCGDSTNPGHGHFGIHLDVSDNNGIVAHCLKCGAGGLLTDNMLDDLGINLDQQNMLQLRRYNKKVAKLSGNRTVIQTERFKIPEYQPTTLNIEKLEYISNRIGQTFRFEDAKPNKLILSLNEFMAFNEITSINCAKPWLPSHWEKNYVGFLSSNNNCITFRCIRNNPKYRRYDKVILNPLNTDNATFYSIPSQLDLFYEGNVNVYIAEGTFDILGVKYNLRPETKNQIFYAACGYSYISIIKNLARHGIITNINIHIYADADKSDYEHIKLLRNNEISSIIQHAYLHRNNYPGEKDYGVPKTFIKDTYRKLW